MDEWEIIRWAVVPLQVRLISRRRGGGRSNWVQRVLLHLPDLWRVLCV
jgi:hypothetical protein